MTTMIYRGVAHDGAANFKPRVAQNLLYRGVHHDGMCKPVTGAARPRLMSYRGVQYVISNGAVELGTVSQTGQNVRSARSEAGLALAD